MTNTSPLSGNDDSAAIFSELANIDIYLLDQLLKGRIHSKSTILDAGCGNGRNIGYMIRHGFDVSAVDNSAEAISVVRAMAEVEGLSGDRFRNEELDRLSFQDGEFDVIICNAVFHFSRDEEHFNAQLGELWRVLSDGGMLFTRLASSIGIESRVQHIDGRHYLLPDGTRRFLVDEAFLLDATEILGGKFIEPIKTVNVQGLRCMTTWVVSKPGKEGT